MCVCIRPGNEVQDSPQEPADRLTEVSPRGGTGIALHLLYNDDSDSDGEEGGALGLLLLDGSQKEALRKGRDKLQVSSPPPPEQSRKQGGGGDGQSPRQQTPRQRTAEMAGTVRTAAPTEPMPASESVAASPPVVADRLTRSVTPVVATPSSSSLLLREEGAAATAPAPAPAPTPAAGRQGGSVLPPRSPVPRVPLVTKGFDSSDR